MAWRVAKSLETLRKQVNNARPTRSRVADGTIGDAAHASRKSDHNPWVKDGAMGVVTAWDVTHDPKGGVDAHKLAEHLRKQRDPRIKYIISNKRICNSDTWEWRPYSGSNPHSAHVHISVKEHKNHYDDQRWWHVGELLDGEEPETEDDPMKAAMPTVRRGSRGASVEVLQLKLGVTADGVFGAQTEAAVKSYQRGAGLDDDGIVGFYTWQALLGGDDGGEEEKAT
jgi:hypothetical protein